MLNKYTLLFAQLIAHLSIILMVLYAEWYHWLITFFIYFLNGCLGMTMMYHRYIAHKSWNPPLWFFYFGTFCATIGLTGSAISWVAVHRKHHIYADTDKDPHSPWFKGFVYCQWFSMFEKVELRYILDITRNKFLLWQHKYYFLICFIYISLLYLLEPFAVIYAFLVPACILWNAGSSIITLGHIWGTNEHKLKDKSKNNFLLGLLVWGEGWHNNHHHDPKSPFYGKGLRQPDAGGILIQILDIGNRS